MYCNVSINQVYSPMEALQRSDDLKVRLPYIIARAFEKINGQKNVTNSINDNFTGYTGDNYKEAETVYSMTYAEINQLAKNYVKANKAIKDISELQADWNGNGARPFSAALIEKCHEILNQLAAEPFVCPTACGAVQFEYEKENGEYLEFEIYNDRIEAYSVSEKGTETEKCLSGINEIEQMKQMVVDFYG